MTYPASLDNAEDCGAALVPPRTVPPSSETASEETGAFLTVFSQLRRHTRPGSDLSCSTKANGAFLVAGRGLTPAKIGTTPRTPHVTLAQFCVISRVKRRVDTDSAESLQPASKPIPVSFRHLLEQDGEMVSTDEGRQTDLNMQKSNADSPRFESLLPDSNVTVDRFPQPEKHFLAIVGTGAGMQIEHSE
jgi:hypothetical protein